jgi:hypothetical protein
LRQPQAVQPVPKSVLGDARHFGKSRAESPLRRNSATASTRVSAVQLTRPRVSCFKIVSWLSITSDTPDFPRAPFQLNTRLVTVTVTDKRFFSQELTFQPFLAPGFAAEGTFWSKGPIRKML